MITLADIEKEERLPAILADDAGIVLSVNDRFEAAFGWTRKQIEGQPLTTIMPGALRDAHNLGFARFLTTELPTLLNQKLHLKVIAKDGRVFDATHYIVGEKRSGRWVFGATIDLADA